jgi:hypothetical protein
MKMNKFLEAIHDMIEIITGERPETKRNGDRRSEDRGTPDRRLNGTEIKEIKKMMKRARNTDGTYKGDDPTTLDVNEAWTSVFPTREPSMKWTRKQLIDYCNEFGVLHSSRASKKELLKNIKDTYPNGL